MRVALVSDVHGNLTALEAVIADIDRRAPDAVVHGGDLVLMGPSPPRSSIACASLAGRVSWATPAAGMVRGRLGSGDERPEDTEVTDTEGQAPSQQEGARAAREQERRQVNP